MPGDYAPSIPTLNTRTLPTSNLLRITRLAWVIPITLLSACSAARSYNDEFADVLTPYRNGQIKRAATIMQEEHGKDWKVQTNEAALTMKYGDQAVIANLERGRLMLDAGNFEEALAAFEISETIINQDFNERAVISARDIFAESESLLVNQKAMPYRGFVYDQVMMGSYKSLAALFSGDHDRALVEARRVDEVQEAAIRTYEAEADGSSSARKKWKQMAGRSNDNGLSADAIPASYAKFVNPFATLVKGVMRRLRNNPDETGEVDFRNLASMMPDNKFVARELQRVQENKSSKGTVYVIWENGIGPRRKSAEVAIRYGEIQAIANDFEDDLDWFNTAHIALPKFVRGKRAARALSISSGERSVDTQLVSNMDMVEYYEFNQRMPTVLVREIARAVTQETLAHETRKAAKRNKGNGDGTLEVLAVLGSQIYKAVVNQADDRCWKTLAADYHFAALPIPMDRKLTLSLRGGQAAPAAVNLPAGDAILILVRSVNPAHISWHIAGIDLGVANLG